MLPRQADYTTGKAMQHGADTSTLWQRRWRRGRRLANISPGRTSGAFLPATPWREAARPPSSISPVQRDELRALMRLIFNDSCTCGHLHATLYTCQSEIRNRPQPQARRRKTRCPDSLSWSQDAQATGAPSKKPATKTRVRQVLAVSVCAVCSPHNTARMFYPCDCEEPMEVSTPMD